MVRRPTVDMNLADRDGGFAPRPPLMADRLKKRIAPMILVAGAAAAAFVIVPHTPHDHHVDLRLDDAASVTGVQLAWAPLDSAPGVREASAADADDAVRGSTWHFPAGSAPKMVAAQVTLPDGRYALDVLVERGAGSEAFHRVITLGDADHIRVSLRSDPR